MTDTEEIPIEIRARVETNGLFIAIREGDYARAALHQRRLRDLGWIISREPAPTRRAKRRKKHESVGPEEVAP